MKGPKSPHGGWMPAKTLAIEVHSLRTDLFMQRLRIESLEAVAMDALAHIEELAEAWRTGALSEHDGRGGTRSNRNWSVMVALQHAIKRENR